MKKSLIRGNNRRFQIMLFVLFVFFKVHAFGQARMQFELDLGIGFQHELELNDQPVKRPLTFIYRIGTIINIPIYERFYSEAGVFGYFSYGSSEIEEVEFTSYNFSVQIPLYVGYNLNEKWRANLGLGLKNIRDIDDIHASKGYNVGLDFLTKIVYQYSDQVHFTLVSNWSLSDAPDFYFLSKPKNGIFVGMIYQLNQKEKGN